MFARSSRKPEILGLVFLAVGLVVAIVDLIYERGIFFPGVVLMIVGALIYLLARRRRNSGGRV